MSPVTDPFFPVCFLNQRWTPSLMFQVSHCSAYRSMCDVPSIAVLCIKSIECVPGMAIIIIIIIIDFINVAFGFDRRYYKLFRQYHVAVTVTALHVCLQFVMLFMSPIIRMLRHECGRSARCISCLSTSVSNDIFYTRTREVSVHPSVPIVPGRRGGGGNPASFSKDAGVKVAEAWGCCSHSCGSEIENECCCTCTPPVYFPGQHTDRFVCNFYVYVTKC